MINHVNYNAPVDGAQQRELRPDPERRRSAYHAVRAEGRFLDRSHREARQLCSRACPDRRRCGGDRRTDNRTGCTSARIRAHSKYSTLDQINTSNVQKLQRVWTFHTGDKSGFFESTPLVVDGTMYVSAQNGVFALDPVTGAQQWKFETERRHAPRSGVLAGRCRRRRARILVSSDTKLLALDTKTGKLDAGVWPGRLHRHGHDDGVAAVGLQGRADHAGRPRR